MKKLRCTPEGPVHKEFLRQYECVQNSNIDENHCNFIAMLIKFNNVGVSEMKALKQTTDYLFLQQTNCDVRFYFEDGQLAHRRQCQHPFSQKSRVRRNVQPRHARGQAVQQQQKYQKQALLLLKLTFLRLHSPCDS